MLVISRGPGERVLIGSATLSVRAVSPSVELVLAEAGKVTDHVFRERDLPQNPSIPLKDGRVILQGRHGGRVLLAIDAPRDVRVVRVDE